MKKLVLGFAVSAALLGAPALAADMSVKVPTAPAPTWGSWAGFYIGLQVGALSDHETLTESIPAAPPLTGHATTNTVGFEGGGYLGYNWQFGNVVFGAEADIDGNSLSKTNSCLVQDFGAGNAAPGTCFPPSYSFKTYIPYESTFRLRLGYAWGNTLLYATGGFAVAEIDSYYSTLSANYAPVGSEKFTDTALGGTIGAGVEYLLSNYWIGRLEYRFTDFERITDPVANAGGFWNGYNVNKSRDENTVRVGISYLIPPR